MNSTAILCYFAAEIWTVFLAPQKVVFTFAA